MSVSQATWALTLVTAPEVEPVSLTDAKLHLRVDVSDDDDLITALVQATREQAEAFTRRALITQTWELVLDAFPSSSTIAVPLPPLQSVSSIKYKVDGGTEYTFSSDSYVVDTDSEPGRIVLEDGAAWPGDTLYEAAAVRVRFVAGYGEAASDVPESIRAGMKLLLGHFYENREATVGVGNMQVLPLGAEMTWWPYRVLRFPG